MLDPKDHTEMMAELDGLERRFRALQLGELAMYEAPPTMEMALDATLSKLGEATKMLAREREERRQAETMLDHVLTGMEQLFKRYRGMTPRENADAHIDAEADEAQERLDERQIASETEPTYWVCHCGGGDIAPAPDCNPNEDGTVCIDCGRTGQWTREEKT